MSTLKVDNLLLADNTKSTGRILEMVTATLHNSSTTTVESLSGTYTFDIASNQELTTSFAEISGSKISYLPPEGTKRVNYSFNFCISAADGTDGIASIKLFIDGSEVTNQPRTAASYRNTMCACEYTFICNSSSEIFDRGIFNSWTTAKEIQLQAMEHASSTTAEIHECRSFGGSTQNLFIPPTITLTAIG